MLRPRAPAPIPMPYPSVKTILGASGAEALVAFARFMPAGEPVRAFPLEAALARPEALARSMPARGEAWLVAAHGRDRARVSAVLASPAASGRVARELLDGVIRDLVAMDLSAATSKHIDETEKNLRRLFDAAEGGGAILFFDETDALFGRRSNVKGPHDRFADAKLREHRALIASAQTPVVRVVACESPWTIARRRPRADKGVRGDPDDERVRGSMSSQFQLYTDAAGDRRWRLLAENRESIATSSEGYRAKDDALNGIAIVREMRAEPSVYQDTRGEWRWRLVHANGNIVATSGEGYVKRSDCEYGLSLTRKLAKGAPLREV